MSRKPCTPAEFERRRQRYYKACNTVRAKGMQAAIDGLSCTACPYPDTRNNAGRLTWSRHWRTTWLEGWRYIKFPTRLKPA